MSSRTASRPAAASSGKRRQTSSAVGDLAPEVVDQHRQVLVGVGLVEHLGGAQGGARVADQRVRHGAAAGLGAEPVGGGVGGVADEALGPFPLGGVAADAGGVGHHVLHLEAGAVARVHGQEAAFGSSRHIW